MLISGVFPRRGPSVCGSTHSHLQCTVPNSGSWEVKQLQCAALGLYVIMCPVVYKWVSSRAALVPMWKDSFSAQPPEAVAAGGMVVLNICISQGFYKLGREDTQCSCKYCCICVAFDHLVSNMYWFLWGHLHFQMPTLGVSSYSCSKAVTCFRTIILEIF